MFPCNYCSLEFTTEHELNGHTEECRKTVPGPSSSSHICAYCKASFLTAKTLVAHNDTCKVRQYRTTVLSKIETINKKVDEYMRQIRERQETPEECRYCGWKFHTKEEGIAHMKTCRVLGTKNIIEHMYRKFNAVWDEPEEEQVTITPLSSTSSATSSNIINPNDLSRTLSSMKRPPLSFPKPSKSKQEPSRPRIMVKIPKHIVPKKYLDTKSESSSETSSPPSKMFRSSDKDMTEIETKVNATETKEKCDARNNAQKKCLNVSSVHNNSNHRMH